MQTQLSSDYKGNLVFLGHRIKHFKSVEKNLLAQISMANSDRHKALLEAELEQISIKLDEIHLLRIDSWVSMVDDFLLSSPSKESDKNESEKDIFQLPLKKRKIKIVIVEDEDN